MTPLDNVIWESLSGTQRTLSEGNERVRRYARGFSPIVAFADPASDALDTLRPWCDAGEHFYVGDWHGPLASRWRLEGETTMRRMVWRAAMPGADADIAIDATPLDAAHGREALALAELTRPGPFGPRTVELGDYFGCFEAGRLVAMAGERMHAGRYREVSGVCTHPGHQRRGLARALVLKLVRRAMLRGETSFLHVMSDNLAAHALYEQLGFVDYKEVNVRVVAPE